MNGHRPVRIANCSGFFGDRLSAAARDGRPALGRPIDVLTGDWLAELTMLILQKATARNAEAGYASTFLTQMEQVLGTCIDRGIKVVTNAGGLNPAGCAERGARHRRLGSASTSTSPTSRATTCSTASTACDRSSTNLDTGAPFTGRPGERQRLPRRLGHRPGARPRAPTSSSARGSPMPPSSSARRRGGGAGPPTTGTRLAGAVVAGHVIECGAQTTGGNYAFFDEIADPVEAARASRSPRSTATAPR